jgi:hypothetical protein
LALSTATLYFLSFRWVSPSPIRFIPFMADLSSCPLHLAAATGEHCRALMVGQAPWEGYPTARPIRRASHNRRGAGAHDQVAQETTPEQYAALLATARI